MTNSLDFTHWLPVRSTSIRTTLQRIADGFKIFLNQDILDPIRRSVKPQATPVVDLHAYRVDTFELHPFTRGDDPADSAHYEACSVYYPSLKEAFTELRGHVLHRGKLVAITDMRSGKCLVLNRH